ncbi:CNNM domain-containing protein, partial [Stigmatella aurantiaca]
MLVLANGIFAGAEIAIISLRKTRLRELVEAGSSSAPAVLALRDDPERFLATVQIGISVVGATAAAFGG